jgi:hypothetical protein
MLKQIPNGGAVMKTISIFLALINSLFAGFLIALDLSYNEIHLSNLWWSFLKLSTAALIIVVGVSAWLEVMGLIKTGPVLLGGLFLIALGPATIMWAIHLALTTGDMEYNMVVFSASLMIQGLASLLGAATATRNATAS